MILRHTLLLSLFFFPARAAEHVVPDHFPTISAAVGASIAGDTVLVKPGRYAENPSLRNKQIALRSTHGAAQTIIDIGGRAGIEIGPGGEISGFTITNAFGAIEAYGADSLIRSNIFAHNGGGSWGAAIGGNGASPRIEQNIFKFNAAAGSFFSGVISFGNQSSPQIINNLFLSNSATAVTLMLPSGATPRVINNTFVGNDRAIYHNSFSPIEYRNNIIVRNQVGLFWEYANPPTWNHNTVSDNAINYAADVTGTGNSTASIAFYDEARGDFRLLRGSQAIDSGNDGPATDFFGSPRPVDGDRNGSAIVDRGAFEYVPSAPDAPNLYQIISAPGAIAVVWLPRPETDAVKILRATIPGGPYTEVGETAEVSFQDTTVAANQRYFYVVVGVNDIGQSPHSTELSETEGNLPPTADHDQISVPEDSTTILDPLANDTDPNNDPLTITNVSGPGATLLPNGSIQFTPPENFNGAVAIAYTITDNRFTAATAEIVVTVTPVNDAPTAGDLTTLAQIGTTAIFSLSGLDLENDTLTYELVTEPVLGRVELTPAGIVHYTASRSASPQDIFTYRAFDGAAYSPPAQVTIQRLAPADTDHDGIADYWENQYDLNNPSGDRDGDGSSNYDEYHAYTNPLDPASVLAFSYVTLTEDGQFLRFQWNAIGRVRYRVQFSDHPGGPFQDFARSTVEEVFNAPEGQPGVAEFQLGTGIFSTRPARYLRLRVVP